MNLKNASILVVDDDPDVLTAVRLLLKTEVKEVITEKNPENLRWHLNKDHFDLILLDMNFTSSIHTGNEGLFWLNEIKKHKTDPSVIMITAYGAIDLAVGLEVDVDAAGNAMDAYGGGQSFSIKKHIIASHFLYPE